MHWRGNWWGIEIVADTSEDEIMLKDLAGMLDKTPLVTYEDGSFRVDGEPESEPPGGLTLTFNR